MRRPESRRRALFMMRVVMSIVMPIVVGAFVFVGPKTLHAGQGSAVERAKYDIRVAVDVEARNYVVHAAIDLPPSWTMPWLWLYADRLRDTAPSFDEFEAERIYTSGVGHGGYEHVEVRVDGCAVQSIGKADKTKSRATRGRDVKIALCPGAKQPLHLVIDATVALPGRYGTLGVARDTMTLGDPWYPLVLPNETAIVPPIADHFVTVTPADARIVATASGPVSVDAEHPTAWVDQRGVTHAPVIILPTSKSWVHERASGVDLDFVTDRAAGDVRHLFPIEGNEPTEQGDHWDIDAAGVMRGTVLDCLALLRRLGFVASNEPRVRGLASSLVVVEIPERQRLAVDLPGMLVISDHAFRLTPPWDRTRRFHGRPIARRAFAALAAPHVQATFEGGRGESPWAPDVLGTLLVDLLLAESNTKKEGAKALVSSFAFHPSVDQLLYAPRVAFGAALFGTTEEPDPDRHGADRARNEIRYGQFVVEKLRDRIGPKIAKALARNVFHGIPWKIAVAELADHDLAYFWKQWIGPHRKLAYRIVSVDAEGDGTVAKVTVERLGEIWIREPIVVEVTDAEGHRVRETWDAAGARAVVTVKLSAPYRSAVIDPDERIAEDPSLADGHPRFDNETSHVWRPPVLLTGGASYSGNERRLDFDFNFIMRRKYDVDRGFGVTGARNARGFNGSLRWFQNFGDLRDLNNRYAQWIVAIAFQRAPFGFSFERRPVTELSAYWQIGWDTRLQLQDPRSGTAGSINIAPAWARPDGGTSRTHVNLSARAAYLWWQHMRSTTALHAAIATVLGPAFDTQFLGVSDRNMLRAFEADEFLSRSRVYFIIEQRIKAITGVFLDAGHAAWVKSLEIVPFGAVAALSTRDSAIDFKAKGGLIAELGVGVRFHHEYFGVQPGLIAVDFAWPFGRVDDCVRRGQITSGGFSFNDELSSGPAEECVRKRQPFGLWVSAEQTF